MRRAVLTHCYEAVATDWIHREEECLNIFLKKNSKE
jgi:hypothetical protein